MTTSAAERSKRACSPFYYVHISGLNFVWFTRYPTGWDCPGGWSYRQGFALFPHDESLGFQILLEANRLNPVAASDSVEFAIYDDDDVLLPLFSTQQETKDNTALLSSNNLVAGQQFNPLTLDKPLSDAPSSGLLYLGNETISYSSKPTSTTYGGTQRGRYYLVDSSLGEVLQGGAQAVEWSTKLDVPPKVGTFPRTVTGRIVTVLKNYFDPETGLPLPKSEGVIIFRGPLSSFQDADNHLGLKFSADSMMSRLDADICSGLPEAYLQGFKFQEDILEIEETYTFRAPNGDIGLSGGYTYKRKVPIPNLATSETIDEVLKQINTKFQDWFSKGLLLAPWFAKRGTDNKVQIGVHRVGFDNVPSAAGYPVTLIPKGADSGSYTMLNGVTGRVKVNPLSVALGFGDSDDCQKDTWIDCSLPSNWVAYQSHFALYTNSTDGTWSTWVNPVLGGYQPSLAYAQNPPSQAYFDPRNSKAVPVDLDTTDNAFVAQLPDYSEFLVKVGEAGIYRATTVNTAAEEINLKACWYDYHNPILCKEVGEPDPVVSSETDDEKDRPLCTQVFRPTMQHAYIPAGATTYGMTLSGVNVLLLNFILSTGTKGYNSDYDLYPKGWGLGIPEECVDVESFEMMFDTYGFDALKRDYLFTGGTNFLELLESEARTLGFYVTMIEGKITCVPQAKPCSTNVVAHVTSADTLADSNPRLESSDEEIFNIVSLECDWDWREEEFRRTEDFHDLASQMDYRLINPFKMENKGIRSKAFSGKSNDAINSTLSLMNDRLSELSRETYIYTAEVGRSLDNLCIGDVVWVTDTRVPNPMTGARGIVKHVGVVRCFSFDEISGTGEVVVALSYPYTDNLHPDMSVTDPIWNAGTFAPAMEVFQFNGNTLTLKADTYSPYNPDNPSDMFPEGLQVQLQNLDTGEVQEATIAAVSDTLKTVELDVTPDITANTKDWVLTLANYSTVVDAIADESSNGAELSSAYLGVENPASTKDVQLTSFQGVKQAYLAL